jgi:hypothetical protein
MEPQLARRALINLCASAPLLLCALCVYAFSSRPQALFYLGALVVQQSSPTLPERHPLFLYGEFRHFLISTVAESRFLPSLAFAA